MSTLVWIVPDTAIVTTNICRYSKGGSITRTGIFQYVYRYNFSGITNNLSESYNAVLKQENEWKELPVNMLVLGSHFLQTFEHFEIMRGMAGIGDYHLKAEISRASIPPEELVLPKKN